MTLAALDPIPLGAATSPGENSDAEFRGPGDTIITPSASCLVCRCPWSHSFLPGAEAEYLEAVRLYEEMRPGLGAALIEEFERISRSSSAS
jgi:hypothetical protein